MDNPNSGKVQEIAGWPGMGKTGVLPLGASDQTPFELQPYQRVTLHALERALERAADGDNRIEITLDMIRWREPVATAVRNGIVAAARVVARATQRRLNLRRQAKAKGRRRGWKRTCRKGRAP